MKSLDLFPVETLIWYDGPQLLIAQDHQGGKYLCVSVDECPKYVKYFCVGISEQALALFQKDELDMHDAFKNPHLERRFYAEGFDEDGHLDCKPIKQEDIPDDWYVEPGVYLTTDATKEVKHL